MKVIFLADVLNVARAGQSKEVADGYARNYLFPRKLAVLANSQAAAAVEAHLKKVAKQRALEEAEMAEVAKKIAGLEITLKAKVGENERLYGSITGADIAAALSKAAGCEIDKRKIDLAEPIKQVGACDVTVRFTHDITAVIKVNVMSEDAVEEKPAKAEKAEAEKAEKSVKEKKPKAVKAEKEEKPPKEKKAKAPKAGKEEKPAKAEEEEEPALEEKKEKKSKSKAKKTEEAAEAKKE